MTNTEPVITRNNNTTEQEIMSKSQLPYLIQEALETGQWKHVESKESRETYERGEETIQISTKGLRSTDPASYVYEITDSELGFRRTDCLVINLLCVRVAKARKMSEYFDSVSTTTE
jgi:hypothetical protein